MNDSTSCAGIADPAAEIESMREAIREAQTALLRYEVEDVDLQAGEEMSISVNADDQQSLRAAIAKLQPFLPDATHS